MGKSVKACDFVIFCCLRSRFVQEKDVDLSGGGAQVLCSWVGRMDVDVRCIPSRGSAEGGASRAQFK